MLRPRHHYSFFFSLWTLSLERSPFHPAGISKATFYRTLRAIQADPTWSQFTPNASSPRARRLRALIVSDPRFPKLKGDRALSKIAQEFFRHPHPLIRKLWALFAAPSQHWYRKEQLKRYGLAGLIRADSASRAARTERIEHALQRLLSAHPAMTLSELSERLTAEAGRRLTPSRISQLRSKMRSSSRKRSE